MARDVDDKRSKVTEFKPSSELPERQGEEGHLCPMGSNDTSPEEGTPISRGTALPENRLSVSRVLASDFHRDPWAEPDVCLSYTK